jgi:predicted ABC-type ATPase
MPDLYVIGGPNGAGKTTLALRLFPDVLKSNEFVNADFVAKGLSAFNTESVAVAAGRLMLKRVQELRSLKKSFAFETTLASRSLIPFLEECKSDKYRITLIYVWVESPEVALERVRKRVKEGGHSIPDEVVRRRYERSISNLIDFYLPLADEWRMYDNTHAKPRVIGYKDFGQEVTVEHAESMDQIMKRHIREPEKEYVANKVDLAVKAAIAEELDRKRKLGLPMVFGGDGKVIVMIGDKIVEERPYGAQGTNNE